MLHVASLLPQGPTTQIQRVTENKANDVQGACLPCNGTSFTLGTTSETHHQGSAHTQNFCKVAPEDHWLESMCQVK